MTRQQEYSLISEYSEIVDEFVKKNGSIPTQSEFSKLGGNIDFIKKYYSSFREFCNELGYENLSSYRRCKKFYLVDVGRNNEVVDYDTMRNLQGKYFQDMKVDFLR